MRLENKKGDEAEEKRGEKGEEGSTEPPPPPHLLIAGGGDSYSEKPNSKAEIIAALGEGVGTEPGWGASWGKVDGEKPSSKADIIAALGEGVGTADGWSWDVEHVSWAEHEGANYEPGFEPWAEQWAAGPGSFASHNSA